FYNGGTDSKGKSGINYGVSFLPETAQALTETDPDANFSGEPSAITAMFFESGPAILNYSPGFSSGFSFYYTTIDFTGQVDIYDGLNASGNLLGSLHLSALGEGPDLANLYSNWEVASLSFTGLAKSVNFSGTENEVAFDNLTFGSLDPNIPAVPEPSTAAQFLLGFGLIAALRRFYTASKCKAKRAM
ncbi:MAG: PEP-CTERM sorting domain-containing protein, partial [Moraxellaceae bacterium]